MLYRVTSRLDPRLVLGLFLKSGLRRTMARVRPDVVVSVLPAVNGVLANVAHAAGVRVEVVLTDWHLVHPLWVARGVDHYTAPTDSARLDCIRFGAPAAAIDVVGIPVRAEFAQSAPRDPGRPALRKIGLDPEAFTILAMVGAEGSPLALANIAHLAQLDLDAQLVVVCGHNEDLRKRVDRLPARVKVHALGFVDNVAELMRASDLLVTKAGGVTLAEAFCCQLPVVVHDVLPGQEAGNLDYVLQHQAVEYGLDPPTLAEIVQRLRRDSQRRSRLAERGARLARPEAARQIVRGLLERLES
jgi:UDP-N-acetylglucosamine:LPS N-acetylglucosamine transferase